MNYGNTILILFTIKKLFMLYLDKKYFENEGLPSAYLMNETISHHHYRHTLPKLSEIHYRVIQFCVIYQLCT